MLDAWSRDLGTNQGRIEPVGAVAPAGAMVLCLGFDTPLRFEELAPGDFVQVAQEAGFAAGARVLRITAIVRPPAVIPAGYKWVLSLRIDDDEHASYRLVAGGPTRQKNFAANISKLASGSHVVTLRLQFLTDDAALYVALADFELGP